MGFVARLWTTLQPGPILSKSTPPCLSIAPHTPARSLACNDRALWRTILKRRCANVFTRSLLTPPCCVVLPLSTLSPRGPRFLMSFRRGDDVGLEVIRDCLLL